MNDDRTYFARRFDEEANAAITAEDARVSEAHARFADQYRERLCITKPDRPLPVRK